MATVREERAATTWQCVRDRRIVGALGALGAAESPRRPSRCTRPWPTMDGQGERDEASWAVDGYLPMAYAMATLRGFPIVLVATNHEDASLPNVEAGGSVAEVRECQRHGRADRRSVATVTLTRWRAHRAPRSTGGRLGRPTIEPGQRFVEQRKDRWHAADVTGRATRHHPTCEVDGLGPCGVDVACLACPLVLGALGLLASDAQHHDGVAGGRRSQLFA